MKRPLTGLVVAYAAGILVGSWIGGPVIWWAGMTAGLVGLFLYFRAAAWLWLAILCAGIWAYRLAATHADPLHITHLVSAGEQDMALRGVIIDDPGYRAGEAAGQRHQFKLQLEALKRGADWEPARGKVLIIVSEFRALTPVHYGDVLECTALLRPPTAATNPGVFDWRRWLARHDIQFVATIRKLDACATLATGRGNPLRALSLRLRESFERALRVGLEDQPRLAGVLAGMVIGERSEIPADTYASFQQAGVFHVFAISGLHVGIVTLVVVTMLRLLRVPRRWCGLVAIPVLIVYVFATGGRPGALRALVMATVWLGSWLLVRPADSLNNLAAAALVILLGAPMQLFDGGFLLSFAVVWALVVIAPRIEARLLPVGADDPLVPEELRSRWRRLLDAPVRWFVKLVSCTLAAWIGLLPLMAVYFNLFTPISILANIVVVPLVGLIIPVGILSGMAPAFSATLNNANFFLLDVMIKIIDWLSQVRWGYWFVQTPPVWLTVTYYVLLLGAVARAGRLRWLAVPVTVFVVALAWPRNVTEITVLDLRDGFAVFVNQPGEEEDWLIDGGSDWGGARVVLPYLRGQGVDRLQTVLLTRGDKAHAAGLSAVTKQVPTRLAIHNGTGSRSEFFWDWLAQMRRQEMEIVTWRAGTERSAGKLKMRVLHPPAGTPARRSDDNSLVLLLEYGTTRVLLASDIGASVEQRLAANGGVQAQVLIKGRHGVETSGTEAFLDAVQPKVVIQALGMRQSDRVAQPELRERLRARGTRFLRTDETGAVTVRLHETGYTIQTCVESAGPAR